MLLTIPKTKAGRSFDEIISILDGRSMPTDAGISINTTRAMQQATVWTCVRILSEAISQLPIYMQRRVAGMWTDVESHRALDLLYAPNDWQTPHEFMGNLVSWMELRGNGYALKGVSRDGTVLRLLPLEADSVDVKQERDWTLVYNLSGTLTGEYRSDRIMHLRNFSTSGVRGLSTIAYARETIGMALQIRRHGSKLFANGASIGKWLEVPTKLGDSRDEVQRALDEKYSGAANAHKTLILEGGAKLHTAGMTSEDAQFLETLRFTKQEIAALFGVPLFLLNDTEKSTTWGSGLEQLSKAFVRYTLSPRLSRISQTLNRELLPAPERSATRFVFDTDAFVMGEFKERMEGYRAGIEAGVINPNEAREKENMNPRAGGDEYRQPMNIGTEGEQDEM